MSRITKQSILNKDDQKRLASARKNRVVNGRLLNSDSDYYKVEKAVQLLKKAGFANFENTKISEKECALNLLNSLNISVCSHNSGYSLLPTQTNKTELEFNTTNMRDVKNTKSDPKHDKFPNANDPFYELDDQATVRARQRRKQLLQKQMPNLVSFTSGIVDINMIPGTTGLKQFAVAEIENFQTQTVKYKHRTNMPSPASGKGNPSVTSEYSETAGVSESSTSKKSSSNSSRNRSNRKGMSGY